MLENVQLIVVKLVVICRCMTDCGLPFFVLNNSLTNILHLPLQTPRWCAELMRGAMGARHQEGRP